MTRKRGAQPGNRNSYKHGFYASQFNTAELRLLSQMPPADLSGEIELMRIATKRFMQAQAALSGALDVETHMSILRAITLSSESINSMIRTQYMLAHSKATAADQRLQEFLAATENMPLDDSDG